MKPARFWEKRAEEARNLAKKLEHPTTKREMLLIALAYDKLAAATREVSGVQKTPGLADERGRGRRRLRGCDDASSRHPHSVGRIESSPHMIAWRNLLKRSTVE